MAALSLVVMNEPDQVLDQLDHGGHDDRRNECGCHRWPPTSNRAWAASSRPHRTSTS